MDAGIIRPNTSPDLDNYVKLLLDALNGLIWEDDRYIIEMHSAKYFTTGEPKLELFVEQHDIPSKRKEMEESGINAPNEAHLDMFFD